MALDSLSLAWTDVHALNAGDIAIARFTRLGVRVNPSCRLRVARRRIERVIRRGGVDSEHEPELAYRVAESHRTLIEFYLISSAIGEIADLAGSRLTIAMGGNDLPDDDVDSRARDVQFELLVAALIQHAGITGISLGEPDIRIQAGPRTLGVAAKRLSSGRKLQTRMREAARQIRQLNDYGIVALSLDVVARKAFEKHGIEAAREVVNNSMIEAESHVRRLSDGGCVVALQGFATMLGWQQTPMGPAMTLEVLAPARWSVPENEKAPISRFLGERGQRLAVRIQELVQRLV